MVSTELAITTLLNGLVLGTLLVLVSLGLTLTFGLMRVINFAHGSFYMIGAYATVLTVQDIGFLPALLVGALVTVVFGICVEYALLRPLYDQAELLQLLVTFGLVIIIREVIKLLFGGGGKPLSTPPYFAGHVDLGVATYAKYNFFLLVVGVGVVGTAWALLEHTNFGTIVRGGTEDAEIIETFGINIKTYWTLTFAAGAGMAGLAGGLAGPIRSVNPGMDISILLIAFAVVIVGGLGSFVGSIVSGLLLGLAIAITSVTWSAASDVIVFIVMAVVLLVRPEGLMGDEGVVE